MKKIDKLILSSFIGPFLMTFLVVVFILLTQHMLKYFDDIIGKDLGWSVLGQLLFYFAIFMTPVAMPLAVLLSSLITYGNLGEHFELTAIKGSGISLLRTLRPIFFFVLVLTGIAFYANNNLVPKAALEAYSLLYDIKQKKPSLDLREGTFYSGIPDISIKVDKKHPDGVSLEDVVIYDHRKNEGNKDVIVADSGRMYTILNEQYLKLELFDGFNYTEGASSSEQAMTGQKKNTKQSTETMRRSEFARTEVVFDLSSFNLERTDKRWFQGNRIMRNLSELNSDIDSINNEVMAQRLAYYQNKPSYFTYQYKNLPVAMPAEVEAYRNKRDSLNEVAYLGTVNTNVSEPVAKATPEKPKVDTKETITTKREVIDKPTNNTLPKKRQPSRNREKLQERKKTLDTKRNSKENPKKTPPVAAVKDTVKTDTLTAEERKLLIAQKIDSIADMRPTTELISSAANMARQVKGHVSNSNAGISNFDTEKIVFKVQWHKIIANSLACIAMFLIGAPLGAIIKRGGLGVPFLVSIVFFIVFYLLNMQGEKLAKQGTVSPAVGVWAADFILLFIGLFFLRQARKDARLFEADFYMVVWDKVKNWVKMRKTLSAKPAQAS